jgi:hypothetical protein
MAERRESQGGFVDARASIVPLSPFALRLGGTGTISRDAALVPARRCSPERDATHSTWHK